MRLLVLLVAFNCGACEFGNNDEPAGGYVFVACPTREGKMVKECTEQVVVQPAADAAVDSNQDAIGDGGAGQ